jgi:flavin reductase (DIM6/NTAB) family NADH-FMN oxidoreductase RutF
MYDDEGTPHGMTVSSLTPVVADPPTALVCIGEQASMRPLLTEGRPLCLSFLGPEQVPQSMGFAFGEDDPFAVFGWSDGANGAPALDGAVAHLFGSIDRVVEHDGTSVTMIRLETGDIHSAHSLVYWKQAYFAGLIPVEPATSGRW